MRHTNMRAHYLQHVPFEGLGSIHNWLLDHGYSITQTAFYEENFTLPQMDAFDLLIVMGGPMSVNDEKDYGWLKAEKAFIKQSVESGKAVLGVCLGAQLIANSFGGKVYPGSEKEIGWWDINAYQDLDEHLFRFPAQCSVMHWHGETFELPDNAQVLARSKVTPNQAFQIGNNVIGLQFHLETTPETAKGMTIHCADELVEGENYIQSAQEILSVDDTKYQTINTIMCDILDFINAH